tara:strand:- start:279 stop:647 length:369 start_codon:yes stop_codon:yes gene_type:complete
MSENKKTYKTIGEVAKILDLYDRKTGKPATYTIRFWEKEFKQIRPYIFSGKRRYYNDNTIEVLKKIKHLLKNEGMTIKGVKKQLNYSNSKLDEIKNKTINKKIIKTKLNKISNLIKNIKYNG